MSLDAVSNFSSLLLFLAILRAGSLLKLMTTNA